jgi:hypothetical protein
MGARNSFACSSAWVSVARLIAAAGPKIVCRQIRSIRVLSPWETRRKRLSKPSGTAHFCGCRFCLAKLKQRASQTATSHEPRRHARLGCTQTMAYLSYPSTYVKRSIEIISNAPPAFLSQQYKIPHLLFNTPARWIGSHRSASIKTKPDLAGRYPLGRPVRWQCQRRNIRHWRKDLPNPCKWKTDKGGERAFS